MAKLAAEAVNAAIRQLSDVDLKPEQASALEVFITASRLAKRGLSIGINAVDAVVDEVFANLGDDGYRIVHKGAAVGLHWQVVASA